MGAEEEHRVLTNRLADVEVVRVGGRLPAPEDRIVTSSVLLRVLPRFVFSIQANKALIVENGWHRNRNESLCRKSSSCWFPFRIYRPLSMSRSNF